MQYKRCPQCGEMNRQEDERCYQCDSVIPEAVEAPIGDPGLAQVKAEKLGWDLSLGRLVQDSIELYARTFPRLLLLLLGLTGTVFVFCWISLMLLLISPWFLLLLTPMAMVLACSFWSSHLCLLVDSVRGNARPLAKLIGVGLLRGINLAWSLLLASGVLVAMGLVALSAGIGGVVALWIFFMLASVYAYPYLPVLVLEMRGPVDGFFRAVELTENFRLNILLLLGLNMAVAGLIQVATLAIMGGADAVIRMMPGSDMRALIPMTVAVLTGLMAQVVTWSLSTVMAFVVFWKRTNGDKVGLFL